MSRSPQAEKARQGLDEYVAGWQAIFRLLREGRSWSGRERNSAFLNCAAKRFADASAATGLDFPDDGRALAVVDWDQDGDLDLWFHNRTGPRLRLMLNRWPGSGNDFVALRLRGRYANRDGIGARVEIELAGDERPLVETLYAGDGYLSQSSKWLHFGLGPAGSREIHKVAVRWPGGDRETFSGVRPGGRYLLAEGAGRAEEVPSRAPVELAVGAQREPEKTPETRLFLASRVPLPGLRYAPLEPRAGASGETRPVRAVLGADASARPGSSQRPLLLNLWASWCLPCVAELEELTERRDELRAAGLEVLALTVEEVDGDPATAGVDAARLLDRIGFPFARGAATAELLEKLELVEEVLYDRKWPLGVPMSFLVDSQGRLAAAYRGRVDVDLLLGDVAALDAPAAELHDRSAALPGRWHAPAPGLDLLWLGRKFRDAYPADMERYLSLELARADRVAAVTAADLERQEKRRGAVLMDLAHAAFAQGRPEQAMTWLRQAIEADPDARLAYVNLAQLLRAAGRPLEAVEQYRAALAADSEDPEAHYGLATTLLETGDIDAAFFHLREASRLSPGAPAPLHAMVWTLLNYSNPDDRRQLGEALELAERGVQLTGREDARMLDALAAAQASVGQFDLAVATAEEALGRAIGAQEKELAAQIDLRLRFFRRGQPFREGVRPPA